VIRAVWVTFTLTLATLFFGSIAMVASLFRVRGKIYYWCTRNWARTALRVSGVRVRVHHPERLLRDEPQIVVSNHLSFYDIFALAAVLPLPFHFVGKKDLEKIPFFGLAWRAAGHISLDRSNRRRAMESLREAGRRIRSERSAVIIFAEGTRSRTGQIQPFKRGAFILAREAEVPIVPVAIEGSFEIMQPDRWAIRPSDIHVRILPIFPPDEWGDSSPEELAEVVHDRIRAQTKPPAERVESG